MAQLGAARTLAEGGDAKAALDRLAALKASTTDELSKSRIETTEDCIRRMAKK